MRSILIIGIVDIVLGIFAFVVPVKFYTIAMSLFTPSISPPFGIKTVQFIAFLLFLIAIILVVNGLALLFLGKKLERVPELKAFSEAGEYLGELKGVEIEEGEVERFEIEGEETEVVSKEEVSAIDDVMLLKEKEEKSTEHPMVGKEVYTELGEFLGYVESTTLGSEGEAIELLVAKGDKKRVVPREEIESSDGVIIVKAPD